jgi:hypothetical protein
MLDLEKASPAEREKWRIIWHHQCKGCTKGGMP